MEQTKNVTIIQYVDIGLWHIQFSVVCNNFKVGPKTVNYDRAN